MAALLNNAAQLHSQIHMGLGREGGDTGTEGGRGGGMVYSLPLERKITN